MTEQRDLMIIEPRELMNRLATTDDVSDVRALAQRVEALERALIAGDSWRGLEIE